MVRRRRASGPRTPDRANRSAPTLPTEDFVLTLISSSLSAMPLSAGTRLERMLVLLYLVSGLR